LFPESQQENFISMGKTKKTEPFRFKQFAINQDKCNMKVGTDGVLLGAWATVELDGLALDIGTGTGLIALMLAQRNPELRVHAVEIDPASCHQAAENFATCPWSDRLDLFDSSIQDFAAQTSQTYDLIVSNPPFFSGGTFTSPANRQLVRHTVKLPHGDLLKAVQKLLSPIGSFCVVLPVMEGLRFIEMAGHYNLHCVRKTNVRPKPNKPVERLLIQLERQHHPLVEDELVIQQGEPNEWTPDYKALTGEFYLDF
jgi:tRNA1Val (adenine37-N6)-methyltransferase